MKTQIIAGGCIILAVGIALYARRPAAEPPARELSHFALWKLHAGDEFAKMRAQIASAQLASWNCGPLPEGYQVCEIVSEGMPTTGVAGQLRVLVDATGSVVAVRFAPELPTYGGRQQVLRQQWEDEAGTIVAGWEAIESESYEPEPFWPGFTFTTWLSPDAKWVAGSSTTRDGTSAVAVASVQGIDHYSLLAPGHVLILSEAGFDPVVDQKALRDGFLLQMRHEAAAAGAAQR